MLDVWWGRHQLPTDGDLEHRTCKNKSSKIKELIPFFTFSLLFQGIFVLLISPKCLKNVFFFFPSPCNYITRWIKIKFPITFHISHSLISRLVKPTSLSLPSPPKSSLKLASGTMPTKMLLKSPQLKTPQSTFLLPHPVLFPTSLFMSRRRKEQISIVWRPEYQSRTGISWGIIQYLVSSVCQELTHVISKDSPWAPRKKSDGEWGKFAYASAGK